MYKCFTFTLLVFCFYAAGNAQHRTKRQTLKPLFPLQITFKNCVGKQLLLLDSTYINPNNETFSVRNFRYYISNFSIIDINGKAWPLPQAYYLIDERKPESKNILLPVPLTQISAISFSVGIDSIKNVSGVQTGALDPANGMFWTWNSGYIMAKLEGSSPASSAPQNGFTYHIGGFRKGENVLRQVTLKLPQAITLTVQQPTNIYISADLNLWFSGSNSLKIREQPFVMQPGLQAMQIADNYSRMFSIALPD